MKILVFGTGGVGGYFGGRLAQAGQDVTFIARGKHLEALKRDGLRVESISGDFTIHPVRAADTPTDLADVILVATKAWDVPAAAIAMKPALKSETIVLPLCNGIDAPAQLAAELGEAHVLGGLCRISAFIGEAGLIKHVGVAPSMLFGELNGQVTPRVKTLKSVFESCLGLKAEIAEDINVAMWEKFIFIAAISGVGSVVRQSIGFFRTVPETRMMLQSAIAEGCSVGRALGVKLSNDLEARILSIIDNVPFEMTASMQKDVMDGRPSELDAQNAAVVRLGLKAGLATPTHEFIVASLMPAEIKARENRN